MKLLDIKKRIGKLLENLLQQNSQSEYFHEFGVSQQWGLWPDRTINPLTRDARRYWSQADEDGIIAKIFDRIPNHSNTFLEFGCGVGLQNNTLALVAKGWTGGWVDGSPLPYNLPARDSKIKFQNSWVTKENVVELLEAGISNSVKQHEQLALLSIDLDGNDFHLLTKILENNIKADVIVLEYNARFPVGSEWVMPYNPSHTWAGDDYFGASLTSFTKLLRQFNYKLVACSVQGSNAFYVSNEHEQYFEDISEDEADHYQPPLYYLIHQWAQKASPRTVLAMLAQP